MSKPLDRAMYKRVEWHLHNESLMLDTLREFERDILLSSQGTDYREPVVKRSPLRDPVSRKAFLLSEGNANVRKAWHWVRVIRRTKQWFDGTRESKLFELYYGKTAGIDLVAAAMGTNRREIARLRDNIVFRGTMYAVEERLIKLDQNIEASEENG